MIYIILGALLAKMAGLQLVRKNSGLPAKPNTALVPRKESPQAIYDPSDSFYGTYESSWPDEMAIDGQVISCVTDPISCWEEKERNDETSSHEKVII